MKPIRRLADLPLEGRAVLLRLDLNVPLHAGQVRSDARIRAALPTIRQIQASGARLAVASHLGRPQGKPQPQDSLEPVGVRLSELLEQEVLLAEDCVGDGVRGLLRDSRPGQVLLLENLRFHPGEEAGDVDFARRLAAPFDTYVNDAFGAAHRPHASIVAVVRHVRDACGGPLLLREVEALSGLTTTPARPFVAVVGGAKVSDKIGVLGALLGHVQTLCIGGAMAYTFLAARGVAVGRSRVESDRLRVAADVLRRAEVRGVEVLLPQDHVAAADFAAEATAVQVSTAALPAELLGLDIGPRTREAYGARIALAKTVFWNGPMGVCEWPAFAAGTTSMATALARCGGHTVVGGGDSVAAIEAAHVADRIDHVSTGGGASLELLQHGTLPGLDALRGD